MKKILIITSILISGISAGDFEFIKFKDIELKNFKESRFIDTKKDLEENKMDQCYIEDKSILCLKGSETYASKLDGFVKGTSLFLDSPIIKLKKLDMKGF